MTRTMLRALLACGVAFAAPAVACATETLTVTHVSTGTFGTIVLPSTATTTITQPTTGAYTVTGPAIILHAFTTHFTFTVACANGGSNGCKNNLHTIQVSATPVQGRTITGLTVNISTPSNPDGASQSTPSGNGTNTVSYTIKATGSLDHWSTSFDVGMVVPLTPASASAVATQWNVTVTVN